MRNTKEIRRGEEIIFKTRPRSFVYLQSALIKFIILILIIYFFRLVMSIAVNIQNFIIAYVQLPLVEAVTYILLLLILILVLWIIWNIFSWKNTTYILTNSRVIFKKGILRKNRTYIHYDKIQDITVTQGLIERITSSGDIEIFGGHEHTRLVLNDIPNPKEVEDMINRLIEGDTVFEKPKSQRKKPRVEDSIVDRHNKKFR